MRFSREIRGRLRPFYENFCAFAGPAALQMQSPDMTFVI